MMKNEILDSNKVNLRYGIHLLVRNDSDLDAVTSELPELAELGINFIILEVNYHFAFKSHPELRSNKVISHRKATTFHNACTKYGIEVIPQFQCLGHQSWAKETFSLLTVYPEFDETPGQFPANEGIYCRSWCPQHPGVNPIVFDLIDELTNAFHARIIHIGMDEVFLIGSDFCPRCAGHNPAKLFAKAVNDLYSHINKENKCQVMMWGDRLLDNATTDYGEWEAADNGTHPAIDLIPKDIIICDWHYERREEYPSIPIFASKGFYVIASGWHNLEASKAFFEYAVSQKNEHVLGYLCTTWGKAELGQVSQFPALQVIASLLPPE
jgi:hypothetical protein